MNSTERTKAKPNLTEGPIAKTLFLFSIPILLGNILQTLNGSINSIWVGKLLGEQALAATSNANIIMFLLISAIFGISMASVILIGQNLGAKRVDEAKKVVGTSTVFFVVLSIIVGALGMIFSKQILEWMNTPADAMDYAIAYTKVMFAGVPFMFGYNLVMGILRGSGDAKTPFYFLFLSVGLDIILNPLLITGVGPFPELGIAGSALAALISNGISLILLIVYLYYKKYFLRITRLEVHLLKLNWAIVRLLIQKGLPMGLSLIVVSLSNIFLITLVNSYGSESAAAFGIAMQISSYVQMPAMAIGGAVTSMAAQNIGAGNWPRVNRITWTGVGFNILLTGVIVLVVHFFNREIMGLFLPKDGAAIDIGVHINNVTLWSFILFGIFNVIGGVVRSSGAVMVPLLFTFLALLVVRNPVAIWLSHAYGFDSIWWCFPISFIIAVVLNLWYYKYGKWRQVKLLKQKQA